MTSRSELSELDRLTINASHLAMASPNFQQLFANRSPPKNRTMTSRSTSISSLNLSELDPLTIITPHLAIASHLYPNLLQPNVLTPKHITAIRININSHLSNPVSPPTMLINVTALGHDPVDLIRRARAYGQYRNSISGAQQGEIKFQEEYVKNWFLIVRLEREGEQAQREVLERGWTAYEQVPKQVKRDLGLLEEEGGEE